jgi:SRSO17 transposase
MLERAHAADGPVEWVLADEVYGRSQELRGWLEEQRQSYVLAVACNPKARLAGQTPKEARRADEVVAGLPVGAWQCLSAGEGSKGPRLYDWAWVEMESSDLPEGWKRFLLARRSLEDAEEIAYYFEVSEYGGTSMPTLE